MTGYLLNYPRFIRRSCARLFCLEAVKPLHSMRIDRFCERVSHGFDFVPSQRDVAQRGHPADDEKAGAGPAIDCFGDYFES